MNSLTETLFVIWLSLQLFVPILMIAIFLTAFGIGVLVALISAARKLFTSKQTIAPLFMVLPVLALTSCSMSDEQAPTVAGLLCTIGLLIVIFGGIIFMCRSFTNSILSRAPEDTTNDPEPIDLRVERLERKLAAVQTISRERDHQIMDMAKTLYGHAQGMSKVVDKVQHLRALINMMFDGLGALDRKNYKVGVWRDAHGAAQFPRTMTTTHVRNVIAAIKEGKQNCLAELLPMMEAELALRERNEAFEDEARIEQLREAAAKRRPVG